VGEDAVNRCIARIRRLAESHGGFAIETIPRVGYRLAEHAPAEAHLGHAGANGFAVEQEAAIAAVAAASDTVDAHAPPTPAWRRRHFVVGASVATLLIVIAVGLVTIFARPKVARNSTAPTANPEADDLYLRARLLQDDDAPDQAALLLDRALALDPSFGVAYAARAQGHHIMIVDNYDATEQRLTLERKDIDAARRILGSAAPLVLSMEAQYADLAAPDHAAAIRRMEAAEAAGLVDTTAARQKAMLLMLDDRLDESIATLQSLAVRDPANILVLMDLSAELGLAKRPVEALRVRNVTLERYPGTVFSLLQGRLIFAFTGRTDAWRSVVERRRDRLNHIDAIFRTHWDLLRFEKRYTDLKQTLYSVPASTVDSITSGGFSICCVGRRPVAVYRGWADLLNDDAAGAAAEGRKVLNFVAEEPVTRWNPWFLRTLVAEGSLLTGSKERAASAAREALALMPRKLDTLRSRYASAVAARVLAWAGAHDEAVALLEDLAAVKPGLAPAEITRDPLYSIPLAKNQRYQALVARLEVEITRYDAELKKANATQ